MNRRLRRSINGNATHYDHSSLCSNGAVSMIPQTIISGPMVTTWNHPQIRRKKLRRITLLHRIQSYARSSDGRVIFIVTTTTSSLIVFCFWMSYSLWQQMSMTTTRPPNSTNHRQPWHRSGTINVADTSDFTIVFPSISIGDVKKHVGAIPRTILSAGVTRPDFGGIELRIAEDIKSRSKERMIYHDFREDQGYQDALTESDSYDDEEDEIESYYAFDDDRKRNPYVEYDDPDIHLRKPCRRTKWHRDVPLSCNTLHELDFPSSIEKGQTRFLGNGAYRQVYLTTGQVLNNKEASVLKMFSLKSEFAYDDYEFARMDANVNEKLDGNPRIVRIYSYCGISIVSEAMMQGDLEHVAIPTGVGRPINIPNDGPQLTVRNTLSGIQKLLLSLEMVEAVLLLHTYSGGVIVHDDIQLSQFLISSYNDGQPQLKLNDFNRAEIMLWNDIDHEYCKYRNHPGGGDWRSPEEYLDHPLDEKIDIWSLGNNMYALLTGMYPFYDTTSQGVSQKVMNGMTAYIDPRYSNRSLAEMKLVEIIIQCWIYDPKQRIDIIQLVNLLHMAVAEAQENENGGMT